MVFWSSFAKKVKQAVSQVSFDALKNRVSNIESKYVKKDEQNTLTQTNTFNGQTNFKSKIEFRNPNNNNGAYLDNFDYYNENYTAFKLAKGSTNMLQIECNNTSNYVNISAPGTNNGLRISNVSNPTNNDNAANKGYVDGLINPLNTKVDSVITGLQNGNIVNYTGPYNNSKNYSLAEATTYQDKWYVSNIDNNQGHTPSGSSDQYWELLSEPTINLNPYLTKSEASSTYLLRSMLNTLYPIGSVVMTADGSEHALVRAYPNKFQELTDNDIAYLAVGTNSSSSNTGTFTIQQNNLPNIYWAWNVDWNNGTTTGETNLQTYTLGGSARMDISNTQESNHKNSAFANNSGARFSILTKIYLNGNTTQIPITYTMKPKTLKVRAWKVIANLI